MSKFVTSATIKSLPCRAAVKREMIKNLFWLAKQGQFSMVRLLLDFMEAEGIKVSSKVLRGLAKITEDSEYSFDVVFNKEEEGKEWNSPPTESWVKWDRSAYSSVSTTSSTSTSVSVSVSEFLPKWKPEKKQETHEGNSKSKAKWLRSGKEARRCANR